MQIEELAKKLSESDQQKWVDTLITSLKEQSRIKALEFMYSISVDSTLPNLLERVKIKFINLEFKDPKLFRNEIVGDSRWPDRYKFALNILEHMNEQDAKKFISNLDSFQLFTNTYSNYHEMYKILLTEAQQGGKRLELYKRFNEASQRGKKSLDEIPINE